MLVISNMEQKHILTKFIRWFYIYI